MNYSIDSHIYVEFPTQSYIISIVMDKGKRDLFWLSGIILLAIVVHFRLSSLVVMYPDSTLYLTFAKNILNGQFFIEFVNGSPQVLHPLYSMAVALVSLILKDINLSAVTISAISGSLIFFPVFLLAKNLYGSRVAWLSILLLFFEPMTLHWSTTMLTESLFTFLFMLSILLVWYAIHQDKSHLYFWAGLTIGLSYLARISGLPSIIVAIFWVGIYGLFLSRSDLRRSLRSLLLIGIGFLIVVIPYVIQLRLVKGVWVLTEYGSIGTRIIQASTPGLNQMANPEGNFVYIILEKVLTNLKDYGAVLFALLLPVMIILICMAFIPNKRSEREIIKILYPFSWVPLYLLPWLLQATKISPDERIRYLSPLIPLLFILTARGCIRLISLLQVASKRFRPQLQKVVTVASITLLVILLSVSLIYEWKTARLFTGLDINRLWKKMDTRDIYREIGLSLKKNLPLHPKIMSRKPFIAYHTDGIWCYSPDGTYEEVLKSIVSNNVDYLFMDRQIDPHQRPNLAFLLNPDQAPKELKPILIVKEPRRNIPFFVLYQVIRSY